MKDLTPQEANERCLKTLRGIRDSAAKRDAREVYEDMCRAILIVEEQTRDIAGSSK